MEDNAAESVVPYDVDSDTEENARYRYFRFTSLFNYIFDLIYAESVNILLTLVMDDFRYCIDHHN